MEFLYFLYKYLKLRCKNVLCDSEDFFNYTFHVKAYGPLSFLENFSQSFVEMRTCITLSATSSNSS